jgi:hypothetical protein
MVTTVKAINYTLGKAYTPRAKTRYGHHTNWAAITQYLKAHKGKATLAQLHNLQPSLPPQVQLNHAPYVAYAIRRGWLVTA